MEEALVDDQVVRAGEDRESWGAAQWDVTG